MKKSSLVVLLLSIAILLPGCAALDRGIDLDLSPRRYTDVYLKEQVDMPATPPRIIPGQAATVYFALYDSWTYSSEFASYSAESWRQTGLFKEVTQTNVRVPPAQGMHIQVHCTAYVRSEHDLGVGDMLFLMSLGAAPHTKGRDEYSCNTQMFQNGTSILNSYSQWDFIWFDGGWAGAITLSQPEALAKGYRNAAQHLVLRDVVALKRAYP